MITTTNLQNSLMHAEDAPHMRSIYVGLADYITIAITIFTLRDGPPN